MLVMNLNAQPEPEVSQEPVNNEIPLNTLEVSVWVETCLGEVSGFQSSEVTVYTIEGVNLADELATQLHADMREMTKEVRAAHECIHLDKEAANDSAISASTSKSAAKVSEINAKAAETTASDKAELANTSASVATQMANTATTGANTATTQAGIATVAAGNAQASEEVAVEAANRAEIAAAAVTGALLEAGACDLSGGKYPAPLTDANGNPRSCFWKVTVGGTVSGIPYGVGDSLVYSVELSDYYKIDNTESVTSVNGKQGVVTLNATEVGAMPLTGGNMTGQMGIARTGSAIHCPGLTPSNKQVVGVSDSTIYFGNQATPVVIESHGQVVVNKQGTRGTVYTTLDKPTADDVHALDKSGGVLEGTLELKPANATTYGIEQMPTYAQTPTALRKFRSGSSAAIWHETVDNMTYKLAHGVIGDNEVFRLNGDGQGYLKGSRIYTEAYPPNLSSLPGAVSNSLRLEGQPLYKGEKRTSGVLWNDGGIGYMPSILKFFHSDKPDDKPAASLEAFYDAASGNTRVSLTSERQDRQVTLNVNGNAVYTTGNKPSWADVGGTGYWSIADGQHTQSTQRWVRAGGDAANGGFIPCQAAAASGGASTLGTVDWVFRESWVSNYRGGSLNLDGGGYFKSNVHGNGFYPRQTGISGNLGNAEWKWETANVKAYYGDSVSVTGNITAGDVLGIRSGEVKSRGQSNIMELYGSTYAFMTSNLGATYVCTNAFWDGAAWKKFDNNRVSNVINTNSSGNASDGLVLYHAPIGETNPTRYAYKVYHTGYQPEWIRAGNIRDVKPNTSGLAGRTGIGSQFINFGVAGIPNTPADVYGDAVLLDTWSDGSGGYTNLIAFSKNGSGAVYGATGAWNSASWSKGYQFFTSAHPPAAKDIKTTDPRTKREITLEQRIADLEARLARLEA